MFKKFRLQNYRTHKDTTIEIENRLLIIGSNNSGKSNLLSGLSFFSKLVSNAYENNGKKKHINHYDFFQNKHSLADNEQPMIYFVQWQELDIKIEYTLTLYAEQKTVYCKEQLQVFNNKENYNKIYNSGEDKKSSEMLLRIKLSEVKNSIPYFAEINSCFKDISSCFYYHFQPALMKGTASSTYLKDGVRQITDHKDFSNEKFYLPNDLGKEGANLLEVLKYVQANEGETFVKTINALTYFEPNSKFNNLNVEDGKIKWSFDLGKGQLKYYEADKVSDGLIKAAAVALLCSLRNPPALLLIEEIENGINQRNLANFLEQLENLTAKKCQVIMTSHSPSVVREFHNYLNAIYNVHLRVKRGYVSEVVNLEEAIIQFAKIGSIDEDDFTEDENGKIRMSPAALTELFYNGILNQL